MWTITPSIIEKEHPVDRFALHYVPQTHWRVWHALWFWAMGIGSGIFCLRQFFGISGGGLFLGMNAIDIVGLVLVAVGGLILILDLGKPFSNPKMHGFREEPFPILCFWELAYCMFCPD